MRDQYKCDSFLQFLIFNLQLFVKLDLYQGCHVEWRIKLLFHVAIKNKKRVNFHYILIVLHHIKEFLDKILHGTFMVSNYRIK